MLAFPIGAVLVAVNGGAAVLGATASADVVVPACGAGGAHVGKMAAAFRGTWSAAGRGEEWQQQPYWLTYPRRIPGVLNDPGPDFAFLSG